MDYAHCQLVAEIIEADQCRLIVDVIDYVVIILRISLGWEMQASCLLFGARRIVVSDHTIQKSGADIYGSLMPQDKECQFDELRMERLLSSACVCDGAMGIEMLCSFGI